MDDETAALLALDEIKAFAAKRLREALPYLKTEALEDLLEKSKSLCHEAIEQQAPIIAATKKRISFTSLSAELRNRIYDLAIEPRERDRNARTRFDGDISCFYLFRPPCPPAITRVSRQIRAESLPMFYSLDKITLTVRGAITAKNNVGLLQMLQKWLGEIGPKAAGMIKNFEIMLEPAKTKEFRRRWRSPAVLLNPVPPHPAFPTHSALSTQYRARNTPSTGPTNAANRGRYLQELGVLGYGVKDSACQVKWDVGYEYDEARSREHYIDLTISDDFV